MPQRDGVAGGLVARHGQQDEERAELLRREPLALDLGVHQRRGDVVARVVEPVLAELLGVVVHAEGRRDQRVERAAEVRVADTEDRVRPLEDLLLVGRRHPEHVADDLQGQRRGEVLDEVAFAHLGRVDDQRRARCSDALLDLGDGLGGEGLLHQLAELGVPRVVDHDHRAEELERLRRLVDERDAARRAEQPRPPADRAHVLVADDATRSPARALRLRAGQLVVEAHRALVAQGREGGGPLVERPLPELLRPQRDPVGRDRCGRCHGGLPCSSADDVRSPPRPPGIQRWRIPIAGRGRGLCDTLFVHLFASTSRRWCCRRSRRGGVGSIR